MLAVPHYHITKEHSSKSLGEKHNIYKYNKHQQKIIRKKTEETTNKKLK